MTFRGVVPFFASFALAATLILTPDVARAGSEYTFYGTGDGTSWTDPCNWQATEDCIPDLGYPGKENLDDTAIIERQSGPMTAELPSSEQITLASLIIGEGGALKGGDVTVTGAFSWTGGLVYGKITISGGGIMNVSGADPKELNALEPEGGRIVNSGNAYWSGSGAIRLKSGAMIENTGTFYAGNDVALFGNECCVTQNRFRNTGTFIKQNSTGTTTLDNLLFDNSGIVDIRSGVVQLAHGEHQFRTGNKIKGAGKLLLAYAPGSIQEAQVSLTGATTVESKGTFEMASGAVVLGTGTFTGPGRIRWSSGTIKGTVTIAKGTPLQITGDGVKQLVKSLEGAGRLINKSTATWTGTGAIYLRSGAIFDNLGTFVANNETEMVSPDGCCSNLFRNNGAFVKTGSSGETALYNMGFENTGLLTVKSGVLNLYSGSYKLMSGAEVTGSARLLVSDDVDLGGLIALGDASTFEVAHGALVRGAAAVRGGTFNWTGGTINAALNIEEGTRFLISGAADKRLDKTVLGTGRLISRGTATWKDTGRIVLTGEATFTNAGTFFAQNDTEVAALSCCSYRNAFINTGTFTKSGGSGVTLFRSVFVQNSGTFNVAKGTVEFSGAGYRQSAGRFRLAGGAVKTYPALAINGGILEGAGTITGSVTNNGTVRPGLGRGVLHITGNYTQTKDGTLAVEIGGRQAGSQHDQLHVDAIASLNGRLAVTLVGGFDPAKGNSFRLVEHTARIGSFSELAGVSASAYSIRATDAATFLVADR